MQRKKITGLVLAAFLAVSCSQPESSTLSVYLTEPDRMRDYLIGRIPFWEAQLDELHGGFFSVVAPDGSVIDPERKSLIAQSGNAYAFSRAFMVTGDERYLALADQALTFLYEHGWDEQNGGWFFSVDREGDLLAYDQSLDPNAFKWIFTQNYALLGIAARYEAGHTDRELAWFQRGANSSDTYLWDPVHGGYYEEASADWTNRRAKGFAGTVDAITTHALFAHLTLQEPRYEDRLFALADTAATTLVESMSHPLVRIGFAEHYSADWQINTDEPVGSVAHQLSAVWTLSRAYLLNPDPRYRDGAEQLFQNVLQNDMYDWEGGDPWSEYNYRSGEVKRERKDSSNAGPAILAGLMLSTVSDDPQIHEQALRMASETVSSYMAQMVDPELGEPHGQDRSDDSISHPTSGDFFAGGYHDIETAYLTYLYASAFIAREPFTLHYRFPASGGSRSVRLSPLALPSLRIASVTVDGDTWVQFESRARRVELPPDFSGVIAVTFEVPQTDQ